VGDWWDDDLWFRWLLAAVRVSPISLPGGEDLVGYFGHFRESFKLPARSRPRSPVV